MPTSQGFRNLKVYQLAFKLAMEIFNESKRFPREERYSLTDQIRWASRSVASNIGGGYRKKRYPKMFVSKMADAYGEATETQLKFGLTSLRVVVTSQRSANLNLGWVTKKLVECLAV